MHRGRRGTWAAAWLAVIAAFGCSADDDADSGGGVRDGGAQAGSAASADGGGRSGSGAAASGGSGSGAAARSGSGARGGTLGSAGRGGNGASREVCDGKDNDGNGVADNVDAQGDGVCDCLSIATIGEIGPWSDGGNVFQEWLNTRSPTPAVSLGDQTLTDELLAPFQVIVVLYASTMPLEGNGRMLTAQHEFTADEVAAFERWVRRGGGVMTTIGYTANEAAEVENVNRLLAPFEAGYSTTKLDVNGHVVSWTPHALTAEVSRIYTENGVEPEGSGMNLAIDPGNHVALHALQPDDGHVVVWGDEWITYDSQWADVQDQQVERLWLNILKWLSPIAVCQVDIPGPD